MKTSILYSRLLSFVFILSFVINPGAITGWEQDISSDNAINTDINKIYTDIITKKNQEWVFYNMDNTGIPDY